MQFISRQQQTQRALLDWLGVAHAIAKPCNKLLTLPELNSNTCVSEVQRIWGKKEPLTAAPSALRFPLSRPP
jgi:hypothetical protein